ncbi:hypothetical protein UU9_06904 [Rhodanobacter fulvus Jip2]|uniref:Uncharacterized protein n=1 Tax=Rhodanobacter fulvus Jip2 TaxID=1163408 RepID=I4VTH4_9GAMM|nr:hypothetical protein [Rhodanobacter fulvus]EIL90515.1 hypothetical protein UU9_06904 [Rhodanobacter fulvus Jip2]
MTDEKERADLFRANRFDVEHALSMYAYSYVNLPAVGLYDVEALRPFAETIESCHIYFIGYLPRVLVSDSEQHDRTVSIHLDCLGERRSVSWEFPEGACLRKVDGFWFVEGQDGQRYAPTDDQILVRLSQQHAPLEFDVRYIGQSFGRDGSRSALDRLLSHETLQKIALRQAPPGHQIALILVEVQPNNQLVTVLSPHADELDHDGSRIQAGLDKLFGTSERERVALYEAAMIRYFQPEFNVEFKDSFPSTRLKILQDCYEKDFSAVIAEFCFDNIPFVLRSEKVAAAYYHVAKYNLHSEEERRTFFSF